MSNLKYADVTGQIIKDFYKVYNTLGFEFAEKVYENLLFAELVEAGFPVKQQEPIKFFTMENWSASILLI